ncbi:MAG: NAD-dependent epimerase/dehydratase family protein [Syntrophobacteraceae bacterium]|nr:NAD-dependent epimerase/dehydratase family protein [Syntrophobacteraceae bacterium]
MPVAFITGAAGFVGSHVAETLLGNGWDLRAIRRSPGGIESPGVEWFTGDLRNPAQVKEAMSGARAVFHVAADYRLWAKDPREIYENNVTGTINVMEAARAARVERVVYTSSVGALGLTPDGTPADENTPVCLGDMVGHYKRSKFLAEKEVEKFVRDGLPVVFVHPSTPVGPGDHKPTPTGKILVDFLNRKMPAYLDTGLNIVDVRDVSEGHRLAFEKGTVGEKYILGNRNLTLAQIFSMLEKISGVKAPTVKLPYGPILWLARFFRLVSLVTRRPPLVPYEGVKMAAKRMYFDSSKAVRELGLPQTPVDTALSDAVAWFGKNGYVKRR